MKLRIFLVNMSVSILLVSVLLILSVALTIALPPPPPPVPSGITCIPVNESCDNADNDCDGIIDENLVYTDSCTVGVGACNHTGTKVVSCSAGSWIEGTCGASAGYPSIETCNGVDDDCDGRIDEGIIKNVTCGYGACAGNKGAIRCSNGAWINNTCDPLKGASAEVCGDKSDNDCDGVTDEGDACLAAAGMNKTLDVTRNFTGASENHSAVNNNNDGNNATIYNNINNADISDIDLSGIGSDDNAFLEMPSDELDGISEMDDSTGASSGGIFSKASPTIILFGSVLLVIMVVSLMLFVVKNKNFAADSRHAVKNNGVFTSPATNMNMPYDAHNGKSYNYTPGPTGNVYPNMSQNVQYTNQYTNQYNRYALQNVSSNRVYPGSNASNSSNIPNSANLSRYHYPYPGRFFRRYPGRLPSANIVSRQNNIASDHNAPTASSEANKVASNSIDIFSALNNIKLNNMNDVKINKKFINTNININSNTGTNTGINTNANNNVNK